MRSSVLRFAAIGAMAVFLAGCESVGGWLGSREAPPLPGDRVSVLSYERTLEPDPTMSDVEIRLPKPYENANWPQPGGVATHALYHLEADGNLKPLWRARVGAGASSEVRLLSGPIVANGMVYVLDSRDWLAAFEAGTGKRVWRVNLAPVGEEEGGFGGGVAYANGQVFATTGYGEIISLDPLTGGEFWRTKTGAPFRGGPTVSAGRVFAISNDNRLYALDSRTGKKLWTHSGIVETTGVLGDSVPAVSGGIVIAAYSSGEIFALRVDNGQVAWGDTLTAVGRITPLGALSDINGLPVIDRGRVIVSGHAGQTTVIDIRTGRRIWEQSVASLETPWVAGDFIFLVTTDSEVVSLSRKDGRIRWVRALKRFEDPERREGAINWSGPVLVSNRLILTSSEGGAISISPYDGSVLGRISLPDGVSVAPVVAGQTMYILTNDGELVALR